MGGDGIDPVTDAVTLELHPPTPIIPPDPVAPPNPIHVTLWRLSLPPGCFVERPNGSFRAGEACAASLVVFLDDGTSQDLSAGIQSLQARFRPPSSRSSEWAFRLELATANGLTLPPDPIRGSTLLMVGDDEGQASHSLVRWEGAQ
jgi:hypothetical protein